MKIIGIVFISISFGMLVTLVLTAEPLQNPAIPRLLFVGAGLLIVGLILASIGVYLEIAN